MLGDLTPTDALRYSNRLIEILCPEGSDLIAVMEAYFDESGTHGDSLLMCLSGFLFNPRNSRGLVKLWRTELERVKRKYPRVKYFHMKELAPGGGQFKGVPDDERQTIERTLVDIINARKTYGFTFAFSESEFRELAPPGWFASYGQPYTCAVRECVKGIGKWADKNSYYGRISYIFEAGHIRQGEADMLLNQIAHDEELKKQIRYGSHTFGDKRVILQLQAADVMAWQFRKGQLDMTNRVRPPRRSLISLGKGRGTDSANQLCLMKHRDFEKMFKDNPVP